MTIGTLARALRAGVRAGLRGARQVFAAEAEAREMARRGPADADGSLPLAIEAELSAPWRVGPGQGLGAETAP